MLDFTYNFRKRSCTPFYHILLTLSNVITGVIKWVDT